MCNSLIAPQFFFWGAGDISMTRKGVKLRGYRGKRWKIKQGLYVGDAGLWVDQERIPSLLLMNLEESTTE